MTHEYTHTITTGYPLVLPQVGQTVQSLFDKRQLYVLRVEPMLVVREANAPDGEEFTVYAHEVEVLPVAQDDLANLVPKLAGAFYATLTEWLTADELAEVRRRNATPEYAGVCASHDFCDANEAMEEAFRKVLGPVPARNEDATPLWNAAWTLARARFLTSPNVPEAAS